MQSKGENERSHPQKQPPCTCDSEDALSTVATELRHNRTHDQGTSWEARANTSYLVQGEASRNHGDLRSVVHGHQKMLQ